MTRRCRSGREPQPIAGCGAGCSGALVVDNLAAGGDPNTARGQQVLWLAMIALVTIILFVIGGDTALKGIQAGGVVMGLPFMALMLLMMIGFLKTLYQEARR